MACSGCGARYKRVNTAHRASVGSNPKYNRAQKVPKKPKKPTQPVTPASVPKKMDPQTAIGLLASITSSVIK